MNVGAFFVALYTSVLGAFSPTDSLSQKSPDVVATVLSAEHIYPTNTPTPTLTPTSTPRPTRTPTPTLSPTPQPPTPTPMLTTASEIDGYFEKYSKEYGIDIALLRKIAVCESGYNTTSKSKHGYGGMFQFSDGSWRSTRTHMGLDTNPDLRFNPEESIRTAAFKISRNGTGAWPACSR